MNRFSEINWSGFIKGCIEKKVGELSFKEQMLAKLESDKEFEDWAVEMGRKVNAGIAKRLSKEKLL